MNITSRAKHSTDWIRFWMLDASNGNGRNSTLTTATGSPAGFRLNWGAASSADAWLITELPCEVRREVSDSTWLTLSPVVPFVPKNVETCWSINITITPSTTTVSTVRSGPSALTCCGRRRRTYATVRPAPASTVTCGRTMPVPSEPSAMQTNAPKRRSSSRATPYAVRPRQNIIQASLPMLDGQNSSDGRKKTSFAYRRESASGKAICRARQNSSRPQKPSQEKTRKPPTSEGPVIAYTTPVTMMMKPVPATFMPRS
ncbi:hypothetical protein GCM10025734_21080 [Kitasatospora paranensis]|uniref:hypothetical protein n=1 Tax=Kitasatospora paranensis TaxID=258053 RepID=UPI0031F09946